MKHDLEDIVLKVKEQKDLSNLISNMKDAFCKNHCPVQVGDKVKINGYTYEGKTMLVSRIWLKYSNSYKKGRETYYQFIAEGNILKKDGTPGNQEGTWHSDDFFLEDL